MGRTTNTIKWNLIMPTQTLLAFVAIPQEFSPTVPERFWQYVDKNGPIPPSRPELGSCWIWTGAKVVGYGNMTVGWDRTKKRSIAKGAHIVSWILHHGQFSEGQCVLHKCDNPPCVNPSHLFIGTKAVNNRDRQNKGRTVFSEECRANQLLTIKRRGEHAMAKLTEDDVAVIRECRADGVTLRVLSKWFGVSMAQISRIALGQSWR